MAHFNHTAYRLSADAGVSSPDAKDSPGALFLLSIQDEVNKAIENGTLDEDTASTIADESIPVPTHEKWQIFVDLTLYQEDFSEVMAMSSAKDEWDGLVNAALYMTASSVVGMLIAEYFTRTRG